MDISNCLFIFDIDGTLVDMREIWEKVYNDLYTLELGSPLNKEEMQSMFGPPEYVAHRNILLGSGHDAEEDDFEGTVETLVMNTMEGMKSTLEHADLRKYVLPGVRETLEYLQTGNATLAVATCNFEATARTILEKADLTKYFEKIGYIDVAAGRDSRAKIVSCLLNQFSKEKRGFDLVYLIGDSPDDLYTGTRLGLRTVGVATGHYSMNELQSGRPSIPLMQSMNTFLIYLKERNDE